ncbi:MAG: T9SS type A sorting domain-containing protein, partial [Bacteroidia bacterium]|nr:T9SS type A sorting domain-containing protein [Bacteroidia bacterium]
VVNNYYTRDASSENTVVEVYEATGDYMTGGGYVQPTLSSGRYASDAGKTTNFGFAVKFDELAMNISGHATIILRRTEGMVQKLFRIRTTDITAVAVNVDNSSSLTGGFNATATLTDITDPHSPVEIANNLMLNVKMTDRGIPGTHDGIAITLMSGTTLFYSSNWLTNRTVEMNLADGNVLINSTFNIEDDLVTGIGEVTPKTGPGVEIMAYPNPSPGMVNFTVKVDEGSKTTLDILSMNGTLVYRVFEGYVNSSMVKTINYDSKLPQGIYLYRLKTSNQILYGKIVITRTY